MMRSAPLAAEAPVGELARPTWSSWAQLWDLANTSDPDHDQSLSQRLVVVLAIGYLLMIARHVVHDPWPEVVPRLVMLTYILVGAGCVKRMAHRQLSVWVLGLALLLVGTTSVLTRSQAELHHLALTALAILTPLVFLQSARHLAVAGGVLTIWLFGVAHSGHLAPDRANTAFLLWTATLVVGMASTFVGLVNRGWLVRTRREVAAARDDALEAARVRSEFLANMSHEIRTPMNGVLGTLELLADTPLDQEQREHLQTVRQSGEDLLAIINEILDFARIDAKRIELDEAPFRLDASVSAVARLLAPSARRKGVAFVTELDPSADVSVLGDSVRFRQVLVNLLGNAIKFTDRGEVRLCARSEGRSGGVLVHVEVHDSGPGMTDEAVRRIFEPFTQIDGTLKRRHAGTGLGLAITHRLVNAMGGTIDVRSAPGQGSVFIVEIELATCAPLPTELVAPPRAELQSLTPVRAEGVSVLVVEDNPVNQRVTTAMLTRLGCTCTVADQGQAALDAAETREFDLVLMDCQMPGLDGFETTERLRRLGGWRARVPVIALTAQALDGDRERCIRAGMNDYLSKPVKLDDLRRTLAQHLQRSPLSDVAQ